MTDRWSGKGVHWFSAQQEVPLTLNELLLSGEVGSLSLPEIGNPLFVPQWGNVHCYSKGAVRTKGKNMIGRVEE